MKENLRKKLQEIIRVNHAGERGAKDIYDGQIAALKLKKDHKTLKIVQHMKDQEIVHFDYFDKKMKETKTRPTALSPFWKIGGFAMGFATAILDKKAAMACTTAVEETIDEHYQDQLKFLESEIKDSKNEEVKKELKEISKKIAKFREEELEHRDIGYENNAEKLSYFNPLSKAIKCAAKFAIFTAKKF